MENRDFYFFNGPILLPKISTYSFIYRECGLLQNEKVRDVHSAVTPCRLNNSPFPIHNVNHGKSVLVDLRTMK